VDARTSGFRTARHSLSAAAASAAAVAAAAGTAARVTGPVQAAPQGGAAGTHFCRCSLQPHRVHACSHRCDRGVCLVLAPPARARVCVCVCVCARVHVCVCGCSGMGHGSASLPWQQLHLTASPPPPLATHPPTHHQLAATVAAVAHAALAAIDLRAHSATHPRLGVLDHVSLHPLGPQASLQLAGQAAAAIGQQLAAPPLQLPVYWYGAAHPTGRRLPEIRRQLGECVRCACVWGCRPVLQRVTRAGERAGKARQQQPTASTSVCCPPPSPRVPRGPCCRLLQADRGSSSAPSSGSSSGTRARARHQRQRHMARQPGAPAAVQLPA
jgi:hypothetical protein